MKGGIRMKHIARFFCVSAVGAVGMLAGCAATDSLVQQPAVQLTSVEASEMSFTSQTFLLGFEVHNPNPFPLPVQGLRYHIRLNDQSFAGGETRGSVTVPADGQGSFVVSVDLDLMRSGMQVASLLRSGLHERLDYGLHGNLNLDLPGAPSVGFTSSGSVDVHSTLR